MLSFRQFELHSCKLKQLSVLVCPLSVMYSKCFLIYAMQHFSCLVSH